MQNGTQEAHTALEALIIKALYEAKVGTKTVSLYLPELARSFEKKENESINLVIEMTSYWDEPDLVELTNQDPET